MNLDEKQRISFQFVLKVMKTDAVPSPPLSPQLMLPLLLPEFDEVLIKPATTNSRVSKHLSAVCLFWPNQKLMSARRLEVINHLDKRLRTRSTRTMDDSRIWQAEGNKGVHELENRRGGGQKLRRKQLLGTLAVIIMNVAFGNLL